MRFRILGSFQVAGPEGSVRIGGVKRCALLAYLLLRNGEPVSVDRLVEELWGSAATPGATGTVRTYISQLRQLVAGDDVHIETRPGGYELRIPPDTLDSVRFERLCADAATDADPATRLARLDEALGLWRGAPLGDFAGAPWADMEAIRLEAIRVQARRSRIDVLLALGRPTEAIPDAERMTREHPLDELASSQLMRAYYQAGQQSAALRAYQTLRRALAEQLGIEPGPEVRDLERRILDQDPVLATRPTGHPLAAPPDLRDRTDSTLGRRASSVSPAPRWRRRRRTVAASLSVLVVVAIVAAALVMGRGSEGASGAEMLDMARAFVADNRTFELDGEFEVRRNGPTGNVIESGTVRGAAVLGRTGRSIVEAGGVVTETVHSAGDVYVRDATTLAALEDLRFQHFDSADVVNRFRDPFVVVLFQRPHHLREVLAGARGPSILARDGERTVVGVDFEPAAGDRGMFERSHTARGELVVTATGRLLAVSIDARDETSRVTGSVAYHRWDRPPELEPMTERDLDEAGLVDGSTSGPEGGIEVGNVRVLADGGDPLPGQAGLIACPLEGWSVPCVDLHTGTADADGVTSITLDLNVGYRITGYGANLDWPCPSFTGPGQEFHFSDHVDVLGRELLLPTTFIVPRPDPSDCAP